MRGPERCLETFELVLYNAVKPSILARTLQQVNLPTKPTMWAIDLVANRRYTPHRSSTQGEPYMITNGLP